MAKETKRATPARPALDGIGYLDDDDMGEVEETKPVVAAPRTVASDAGNQAAARWAIENFKAAELRAYRPPMPVVAPITNEDAIALAPKIYRVMDSTRIARGAASYELRAGKIIDSRQYDVQNLLSQGVRLEELPPRR